MEDTGTQSCDSPLSTTTVMVPPYTALGRPTVACCNLACLRAQSCIQCNMTTVPLAPFDRGCQACSPYSRRQATSTDRVQRRSIKVPGLSRTGAVNSARDQSALWAGNVRELRRHQPRRQPSTPCTSKGPQEVAQACRRGPSCAGGQQEATPWAAACCLWAASCKWTCSCSHRAERVSG